jgi:hypothetical protein
MPGKQPSPIFRRAGAIGIDAEQFIKTGLTEPVAHNADEHEPGVSQSAIEAVEARAGTAPEPRFRQPELLNVNPAARKIAQTYKHKEANYRVLKFLSVKLGRYMGDLIDEAVEAKFSEWKTKIPPDPEF